MILTENGPPHWCGPGVVEGVGTPAAPTAVHDPGKVLGDLAIALALGGGCLADVAVLRSEPGVYGLVASDPTVSRTIDRLAADPDRVLAAINEATLLVRQRWWALAGDRSSIHAATADAPVVIDLDATLVTAHSDKEHAAPTYKHGYGFIRCSRSPATAPVAPVNPRPRCCGRGMSSHNRSATQR